MIDFSILGMSVWFIVKIFFLFALAIYSIFAGVLVKQVQVMTETVSSGFTPYLRLVSFIHLILSLAVLVLALVIL